MGKISLLESRFSRCLMLLACLFFMDSLSALENIKPVSSRSPFFVDKVEVTPGGKLMLHPKLPYFDGLPDGEYNLVMNFPESLALSHRQVVCADFISRIDSITETANEIVTDGVKRREIYYKPDLALAVDGIALQLCYKNVNGNAYIPGINFYGTFDWKRFYKEIQVPEDNIGMTPLLLKWDYGSAQSGTLFFRSFQIKEADGRKIVYKFHSDSPIVIKLGKGQSTYWLSRDPAKASEEGGDDIKWLNLIPGKKYIIECEAKGDGIKSQSGTSIKDALIKKVCYARTFIFDIDSNISLPDKLLWRIEGKNGKVFEKGELSLIPAMERIAPKTIDTSVWICETELHKESLAIQQLYIGKFYQWGLNTIEPQIEPYSNPTYPRKLTEKDLSSIATREAKRLGMRVRNRLYFYYRGSSKYCEIHPESASVTVNDKRGRPDICITYMLDGGKYDIPETSVKGGKENPWLSYYYEMIKESTRLNHLDGVFWDFEINAAPFIKSLPNKDGSRRWGAPCMCGRCMRAFKDYANLDHMPTVEECVGKLYDKWVDFRCRQNVRFWQICAQAAKEGNPDATFAIYSGRANDYSREAYGVDWIMAAPFLDFAMQREWCPIPKSYPDSFRTALQKGMPEKQAPPKMLYQLHVFPYGDQWYYHPGIENRAYAELSNIKNNIVRTVAVCGSYGWSFTGIWGLDDQLTLPIKKANAILAKYEDYFVNGKKVDNIVKLTRGDVEIATWQLDERMVTFVFNMKAEPQDVVLQMSTKDAEFPVNAHDSYVYEWVNSSKSWYSILFW